MKINTILEEINYDDVNTSFLIFHSNFTNSVIVRDVLKTFLCIICFRN